MLGLKLSADGTTDKWKARLVGRGDRQVEGRNYGDIMSPVVDSTSICLVLGLAARHNHEIITLDAATAFPGCPLEETLYMTLPQGLWGCRDPYQWDRPIVKLRKTIYGIRQANREFAEEVFEFAVDNIDGLGLKASISSPGLFYDNTQQHKVYMSVYVDDLMLVGPPGHIKPLCQKLEKCFKASGPPPSDNFQYLGMMVHCDRKARAISIDRSGYID